MDSISLYIPPPGLRLHQNKNNSYLFNNSVRFTPHSSNILVKVYNYNSFFSIFIYKCGIPEKMLKKHFKFLNQQDFINNFDPNIFILSENF